MIKMNTNETLGATEVPIVLTVDQWSFIVCGLKDLAMATSRRMESCATDSAEYWDEYKIFRENVKLAATIEQTYLAAVDLEDTSYWDDIRDTVRDLCAQRGM